MGNMGQVAWCAKAAKERQLALEKEREGLQAKERPLPPAPSPNSTHQSLPPEVRREGEEEKMRVLCGVG